MRGAERSRRLRVERVQDASMSSMIDIVFLLLVFFVFTAVPVQIATWLDVTLPSVTPAVHPPPPPSPVPPRLHLAVFPGGYSLEGTSCDREELAAKLKRLGGLSAHQQVLVQSDGQAGHAALVAALDACAAAGLDDIALLPPAR